MDNNTEQLETLADAEPAEKTADSNGGGQTQEDDGKLTKPKRKSASQSPQYKTLKKKLEKLQQEYENVRDQLLRTVADFDNYKKRTEKEFLNIVANANAELITELLPVVDDFERFQNSAKDAVDKDSLLQGVDLIHKNLMKVMEKRGVKAIPAVGQPFDPEKHDALMQVESDQQPSGTIVEEHLKGYEMNDRILRHSQVIVSK
ncbi:MAG: nucleotide exchange factor GrpE [bacterium]